MSDHRPPTTEGPEGERGRGGEGEIELTADFPILASASAPGKLILCGEHAVVYGCPAIAVPLDDVRAQVVVRGGPTGRGVMIEAGDLGKRWQLSEEPDDPLSLLVSGVLEHLSGATPDLVISITSQIPIASGMGSGAAVATALVRALAAHAGVALPPSEVSALVYESERRLHGTPSGIDNTVVAYERPIWFVRRPPTTPSTGLRAGDHRPPTTDHREGERGREGEIEPLTIAAPFTLLVGDTGVRSSTHLPVGEVRRRWQEQPARYGALFDAVATVVLRARATLEQGRPESLGPLLNENHALLQQIGVSSPELDQLVEAARGAGALGAKLSGAGWGGVMLALVAPERRDDVAAALTRAGAARVLPTVVAPYSHPA
jgi:mevalonate kinase